MTTIVIVGIIAGALWGIATYQETGLARQSLKEGTVAALFAAFVVAAL
ncbi:MAG: hypothetical protein UY63_C0001G0025 [Parcubacteria group bacterium GW2011_GWA2_51_10]|nr:MAG: hypothetical protein UY63_C0001G0025 [Parcubacteria group bacterium GW2011_GWA2_51_10]